MIFPRHRVKEQFKQQADLTEEQALAVAASISVQAQGVVSDEDFFYLGQNTASCFFTLPAPGVGNFAAFALRALPLAPQRLTNIIVSVDQPAFLTLINDVSVPGPWGAPWVAGPDVTKADVSWGLGQLKMTDVLSYTRADNQALPGNGCALLNQQTRTPFVLREGWGLIVRSFQANLGIDGSITFRQVMVRVT